MATSTLTPAPKALRVRPPAAWAAALVAVAVLSALALAVTTSVDDEGAASRAGTGARVDITGMAPAFSIEGVRDRSARVTLGDGGRPVVLNFFAAWCIPCRAELPLLQQASQRLAGSVDFVGIDVADSRTAAGELLDRTGVTFPAGYDPDRKVASRYRLQGMPTTVFVDAAGRVAEVARGELTAPELERRLARLARPAAAIPVGRGGAG